MSWLGLTLPRQQYTKFDRYSYEPERPFSNTLEAGALDPWCVAEAPPLQTLKLALATPDQGTQANLHATDIAPTTFMPQQALSNTQPLDQVFQATSQGTGLSQLTAATTHNLLAKALPPRN